MKYIANPVEVEAYKIIGVELLPGPEGTRGSFHLELEGHPCVVATAEMCARMEPTVGDYWVVQDDGYIYLNPKAVLERKYSPAAGAHTGEDCVVRPGDPFYGHVYPADKPVVPGLEHLEKVYAKDQPEYIPLRTLVGVDQKAPVLSRWSPNAEQRQGIARGADIFLQLLTFRNEKGQPNPLQPILMFVADNPNPDYFKHDFDLERKRVPGPHAPPKPPGVEVG